MINAFIGVVVIYFHRFFFFFIFISSFIWAHFALEVNTFKMLYSFEIIDLLKFMYMAGFTVCFWPLFYVELIDYFMSLSGTNGRIYRLNAESMQKDIVVSSVTAMFLSSIYWLDLSPYSFAGVDIGIVGIPFLVYSLYTLFQISRLSIAGKSIRLKPLIPFFVAIMLITIVSHYVLVQNSSGKFETYQAIWFQLTIFFTSFFFYANTNLLFNAYKYGKLELSDFKKYFLADVLNQKNSLYIQMEGPLHEINKIMAREKSKHAKSLRKKKK